MTAQTMSITFAEDEPPPAVKKPKRITAKDLARTAKEADILLAVRQLLSYMGVPASVTDASRAWNDKGQVTKSKVEPSWPDISATWPYLPLRGISLYVETKAARTGFQPGQKECHEALRNAGAVVIVPKSLGQFAAAMIHNGMDHPLLRQILK